MGHRLSRIYTGTGDDGTTGLTGGDRVSKDATRVRAMGAVDELNSLIGLLLSKLETNEVAEILLRVQHQLFNLGGELSMPGETLLDDANSGWLERNIDALNAELGPLKEFILPGGSEAAAICHVARAVARRVERELVSLSREEDLRPGPQVYVNRLSDLLFVLARKLNQSSGHQDVYWDKALAQTQD